MSEHSYICTICGAIGYTLRTLDESKTPLCERCYAWYVVKQGIETDSVHIEISKPKRVPRSKFGKG